jgi:hypothetical protein
MEYTSIYVITVVELTVQREERRELMVRRRTADGRREETVGQE